MTKRWRYGKSSARAGSRKEGGYRIGLMYYRGEGVLKDYVTAYFWLNIGSADGYEKAKEFLAVLEKEMVPEQIAKAQELGREYVRELNERLQGFVG